MAVRALSKRLAEAEEQIRTAQGQPGTEGTTQLHEQQSRIEIAIRVVKSMQLPKKCGAEVANTRASTTDPDTRVMWRGDGGY